MNPKAFYKADSSSYSQSRNAFASLHSAVILSIILFCLSTVFPGYSSADPLDNWQTINPIDQTYSINACAYGAGKFVAVAEHAKILITSDGKTWTIKNSLQTLRAIAYGNDMFVAVGDNGAILISSDGIVWKIRNPVTSQTLRAIVFADGKFVAVGDSGTILTSPFGTVWTTISLSSPDTLRAITFGDSKAPVFVAVGDNGTTLSSYDGTTWRKWESDYSGSLRAIAFGNGNFIAVGDKGAMFISPFVNGWMPETSGTTEALSGIAFGNGVFVAVGDNGAMLTSSDGSAWTSKNPVTSKALYGVGFGDNRFVAVGDYGAIIQSDKTTQPVPKIMLSPDSRDFGKVDLGSKSAVKVFTVSNTGNADLSVKRVEILDMIYSEFELYDLCSSETLGPAESCTLEITFMPKDKGLRKATISISSDDPDQPELNTSIKGTGIMPPSIQVSAGKGGSIYPDGTVTVTRDTDKTFTIEPDEGYDLVDVKVDGVSQGAVTSYEFTGVTANHKITATFKVKTYNITASTGPNGRITPSGTIRVKHGKAKTFFIKPSKGYKIADVLIDGASVGAVSTYTFGYVAKAYAINATFKKK